MPWNTDKNVVKYINKLSDFINLDEVTDSLSAIKVLFQFYLEENRYFNAVYRKICQHSLLLIQSYEEAKQSVNKTETSSPDTRIHPAVEREEKERTRVEKVKETSFASFELNELYQQIMTNIIFFINETLLPTNKSFIENLSHVKNNEFVGMLAVLDLYFPNEFDAIQVKLPVVFDCVKFLDKAKSWESDAIIEVGKAFLGVPEKQKDAIVARLIKHADHEKKDKKLIERSQLALAKLSENLREGPTAARVKTAMLKYVDEVKKSRSEFINGMSHFVIGTSDDKPIVDKLIELYKDEDANIFENRIPAALCLLNNYQRLLSDENIIAANTFLAQHFSQSILARLLTIFSNTQEHLKPNIAALLIEKLNNPIQHWTHWIGDGEEKELPQMLNLLFDYLSADEKNTLFNNLMGLAEKIKDWLIDNIDNGVSLQILERLLSKLVYCNPLLEKLQKLYNVSIKNALLESMILLMNKYSVEKLRYSHTITVIADVLNGWEDITTATHKKLILTTLDLILQSKCKWEYIEKAGNQFGRCILQHATSNEEKKLSDEVMELMHDHYQKIMTELKAIKVPAGPQECESLAFYKINKWVQALGEKKVSELAVILSEKVSLGQYDQPTTLALARLLPTLSEPVVTHILSQAAKFLDNQDHMAYKSHSVFNIIHFLFQFNKEEVITDNHARKIIDISLKLLESKFVRLYLHAIVDVFIAYPDHLTTKEKMKIVRLIKPHVLSDILEYNAQLIDLSYDQFIGIDKTLGLLAPYLTPLQRKNLIHHDMREIFNQTTKWDLNLIHTRRMGDLRHTRLLGSILQINSIDASCIEAIIAKEVLNKGSYLPNVLINIVQEYLMPSASNNKMITVSKRQA